MHFRVAQLNLPLFIVIVIYHLPVISSNKPEGSSDNEVIHKGSALKDMFNSFQLPTEFLEIEKIKKVRPASLLASSLRNNTRSSQLSGLREEIVVKACTPDALPWLGQKGYCVPTHLLQTFCGEYESSTSSDCSQTERNWCCYKPTPTTPPIITSYLGPVYLNVKPCTPDLYPWMGPKGYCSPTELLNDYCSTLEISASTRDCPGRENWCCYKPIPKDELYLRPCRPDVFPQLERTGFCAATNQLNTFCTTLEISVASNDCSDHPGNWCCYTPPPPSYHPSNYQVPYTAPPVTRPPVTSTSASTTPVTTTTTTTTTTTRTTPIPTSPATVGYPKSYCQTNPELPQCQSTTASTHGPIGLPNYFAATPPYLPCAMFGYLPNCASTTATSTQTSLPTRNSYNVYTNLKRLQEPSFSMRFGSAIDPEKSSILGREGF